MSEIFNMEYPGLGCKLPEGLQLLAYRGSIAHGMYVPESDPHSIDDVDLIGVVIPEARHYLGLREWGSRGTQEVKQGQYDCVFYEIKKTFRLLLQGNPNILSLLWLEPQHYLYKGPYARHLLDAKHLFVGRHVYHSFTGYAYGQLEKMESRNPEELREYLATTNELKARGAHPNHKGQCIPYPAGYHLEEHAFKAGTMSTLELLESLARFQRKGENLGYLGDKRKKLILDRGYDTKNAAHCIRLMRMCIEFLRDGRMQVYRPDAEELLRIKKGEWPLAKVKEYAAELLDQAKLAYEESPLPDRPDADGAEALLIEILREVLR